MPPAFDTAITSGALDEAQLIAAWKIGCSMPSSSVMRVFTSALSRSRSARAPGRRAWRGRCRRHVLLVAESGNRGTRVALARRRGSGRRTACGRCCVRVRRTPRPSPGCASRSTMRRLARPDTTRLIWLLSMPAARARWPSDSASSRRAEQRDRAPLPQADAELAPVAQLGAAREQVRDHVHAVGEQVADDLSHRRTASLRRRAGGCRSGRRFGLIFFAISQALRGCSTAVEHRIVRVLEEHHGLQLAHQARVEDQEVDVRRAARRSRRA